MVFYLGSDHGYLVELATKLQGPYLICIYKVCATEVSQLYTEQMSSHCHYY
jgi:hypothetical protein